ncbi:hypothetical protein [uncultured Jannaschia sp.]|uniref:hypothetical protein n=1 Tax=uncultured Jannaschia sp. TaxID=293347 RepID=UPI00262EE1C1|nr:hypothetical protein [uncultured Jannaschia sp.]
MRLRPDDKHLLEGCVADPEPLAKSGNVVATATLGGRAFQQWQAPVAILAFLAIVGPAALGNEPERRDYLDRDDLHRVSLAAKKSRASSPA